MHMMVPKEYAKLETRKVSMWNFVQRQTIHITTQYIQN